MCDWFVDCGSDGKSVCLQCGRPGFDSWVGKIPWRRKWQCTPVSNQVQHSPWQQQSSILPLFQRFLYLVFGEAVCKGRRRITGHRLSVFFFNPSERLHPQWAGWLILDNSTGLQRGWFSVFASRILFLIQTALFSQGQRIHDIHPQTSPSVWIQNITRTLLSISSVHVPGFISNPTILPCSSLMH